MKQWINMSEQEAKKRMQEESEHKKKLVINSKQLEEQIKGEGAAKFSLKTEPVSKYTMRGQMNNEELKMNKRLLKEIHEQKSKEKETLSVTGSRFY